MGRISFVLPCVCTALLGLCESGHAVLANAKNASIASDALETSQSRVNKVNLDNRHNLKGSSSAIRASSKDYDDGFPVQNTYGPPKDYYYDDKSDYYPRPNYGGGYQGQPEGIYPHHHHHAPGGLAGDFVKNPLLWPLAGITLLGAFAVLMNNPLLLHLGTVGRRRRRRRRQAPSADGIIAETIKTILDKFGQKGQSINGPGCWICDVAASVYDQKSACLERSVCEIMSRNEPAAETDKQLLTAMIAEVIKNKQIPEEIKVRLESAETNGKSKGHCEQYVCGETQQQLRL